MRDRSLTRRVLLRGAAAGSAATALVAVSGCSERQPPPVRPAPPDPETVLLGELIAGKERMVGLYRRAAQAAPGLAAALRPFERRHQAHLAELRKRLPPGVTAAPAASPSAAATTPGQASPAASSGASASPSATVVTVTRLRAAERAAAASRPGQITAASPALAQLVACIGACEAAHAIALPASDGG